MAMAVKELATRAVERRIERPAAIMMVAMEAVVRVAVERRRSVGGGSVGLAAMVEVEVVAVQR
jgi:hypothetical protein